MKGLVMAVSKRNVRAAYVRDAKPEDAEVAKICARSYQPLFLSPEACLRDVRW